VSWARGCTAVAHVTGGGIVGNVVRLLPTTWTRSSIWRVFPTPEIFFEIQRRGPVAAEEMVRVLTVGFGMVVALDPGAAEAALTVAQTNGVEASIVGEVRTGTRQVVLT